MIIRHTMSLTFLFTFALFVLFGARAVVSSGTPFLGDAETIVVGVNGNRTVTISYNDFLQTALIITVNDSTVQLAATVANSAVHWSFTAAPTYTAPSYQTVSLYSAQTANDSTTTLQSACNARFSCPILITITSTSPTSLPVAVSWSAATLIYFKELFTAPYYASLAPDEWAYFAAYMTASDLDVLVTLTPIQVNSSRGSANVELTLATTTDPLTPYFPTASDDSPNGDVEEVLIDNGDNSPFPSALYLFGVHAPPATAAPSCFSLELINNYSNASSLFGLSMFGIVAALTVLVLCVFSLAAVIARRQRRSIEVRAYNDAVIAVADANSGYAPTTVASQGATSEQIAALGTARYRDGDYTSLDDAKCAICLDDYQDGTSRVTTLPCAHHFHADCAHQALLLRRFCPLCGQDIATAHQLAASRRTKEIEMTPING